MATVAPRHHLPPGAMNLELKNSATRISTKRLSGRSGEGGLGGKAGLDAATCAAANFKCNGTKTNTYILLWAVKAPDYDYKCAFESKYECNSKVPSALRGKNGKSAPRLEKPVLKVSDSMSIEEIARKFCKISADSAAQEKDGPLNEFLKFSLLSVSC